MTTEDLSKKPCPCGETMGQIIGHDENAQNRIGTRPQRLVLF
jgi:hypothetical protein